MSVVTVPLSQQLWNSIQSKRATGWGSKIKVSYALEVWNDVKTLQSSSDLQFPLSEMLLKWQLKENVGH